VAKYSAKESFERLVEGNRRFTKGLRSIHTFIDGDKMRQLAENGQRPFAVILTCSDSRLPAELLFDQGFGDLFVIRVAGNIVAPSLLASMEFAILNLGTPFILVMGHSGCGAVKAASDYVANPSIELTENLRELVTRIEPSIHRAKVIHEQKPSNDFLDICTWENVNHTMKVIMEQSMTVRKLVESNSVMIQGAVCNLKTGEVTFKQSIESHTKKNVNSKDLKKIKKSDLSGQVISQ
jgi:carbonic anhydrase